VSDEDKLPTALVELHHGWSRRLVEADEFPSAALVEFSTAAAAPPCFAGIVQSVCASESHLEWCAERSFRHPLGFDKFVLFRCPQYELRLHVWRSGPARHNEHIHDHRFAFASTTVVGHVDVEMYRIGVGGTLMVRYDERRAGEGRDYAFQCPELVTVLPVATLHVAAGSAYCLPSETLHRIRVTTDFAATIVVKVPTGRVNTTVLADPLLRPPGRIVRRFFTPSEAERRLRVREIVTALRGAGGEEC